MISPTSIYKRLPMLSRRRRRIAVLAAFCGYPSLLVGYSALVVPGRLSQTIWGPIAIALFSLTLIGVVAVYGYGRGRIDRSESLDERQRSIVDRALIVSYTVLTTAIVAIVGVIAAYASFVGPFVMEMTALSPWLIAIGLYIPFLPFAALAWIEPDAPADDDTPGS